MGKVRKLRSRVHLAAVRLSGEAAAVPTPPEAPPLQPASCETGTKVCEPADNSIFAKTRTYLNAFVEDQCSFALFERDAKKKGVLSKKETMKLRRERWLKKMEAINMAKQKLQEEKRRKATAVVGDMRPLLEALPELTELKKGGGLQQPKRRVTRKPRPTELSQMSAVQRLQLLEEERARFQALLASPAYQASPLQTIGQQLARQMQLEDSSGSQP